MPQQQPRPSEEPKPDQSYERADPNAEPGMGDLDKDKHTPTTRPDRHADASVSRPTNEGRKDADRKQSSTE
jgi:hypothetical protein